jgi:hypothetical protein
VGNVPTCLQQACLVHKRGKYPGKLGCRREVGGTQIRRPEIGLIKQAARASLLSQIQICLLVETVSVTVLPSRCLKTARKSLVDITKKGQHRLLEPLVRGKDKCNGDNLRCSAWPFRARWVSKPAPPRAWVMGVAQRSAQARWRET